MSFGAPPIVAGYGARGPAPPMDAGYEGAPRWAWPFFLVLLCILVRIPLPELKKRETSMIRDQAMGLSPINVAELLHVRRRRRLLHGASVVVIGSCVGCLTLCGALCVTSLYWARLAGAFVAVFTWCLLGDTFMRGVERGAAEDAALEADISALRNHRRPSCVDGCDEFCQIHKGWPTQPRRRPTAAGAPRAQAAPPPAADRGRWWAHLPRE